MIRLVLLIRSLETGGAERQLIELAKGLDKCRFAVTVLTFYDGGDLKGDLENVPGVEVVCLRKRGRWDVVRFLARLWRAVRAVEPHIVHGYMSTANEFALLVGRAARARVVWGLRASHIDFAHYDWTGAWLFRTAALLSRYVDLIIVNSHAGLQYHTAKGFWAKHCLVIPNGIDTNRFCPDAEARARGRRVWGIAHDQRLVGLVARLDPMKDHPTFLRAAALLAMRRPDVRFVCIGHGPRDYEAAMRTLGEQLGLAGRLIWAGLYQDMPAAYNALDLASSSSSGEGFANAVGEAMACGVPCVVTDVGDLAALVGEPGQVVPPRDPAALAEAWGRLLDLPGERRHALGRTARERVVQHYSLERLVRRTESALCSLLP